jgi:AAA15 family ATPase/GTPase
MFSGIKIENFRGIKFLRIDNFKRFNLIVGKNNSAKTTILEALFLLIGPYNPSLPLVINSLRQLYIIDQNTWRLFFHNLDINKSVILHSKITNLDEERNLVISPYREFKYSFPEATSDHSTPTVVLGTSGTTGSSGLAHLISGLDIKYELRREGKTKEYQMWLKEQETEPGKKEIKPSGPKDYEQTFDGEYISFASPSASPSLSAKFDKAQINKQVDAIVEVLKRIIPALKDLRMGAAGVINCDIGLPNMIPINVFGQGMQRILSILLAIVSQRNGIVCIDEIENGLYYSSQKILWNSIFEFAKEYNVQIFATTHSIDCVEAYSSVFNECLKDDDMRLFRVESRDDVHSVTEYDNESLRISIDEDWEMR